MSIYHLRALLILVSLCSIAACEAPISRTEDGGHYTAKPQPDPTIQIRPENPSVASWNPESARLTLSLNKFPSNSKVCLSWESTSPFPMHDDYGLECFVPSELKLLGQAVAAARAQIAAAVVTREKTKP